MVRKNSSQLIIVQFYVDLTLTLLNKNMISFIFSYYFLYNPASKGRIDNT